MPSTILNNWPCFGYGAFIVEETQLALRATEQAGKDKINLQKNATKVVDVLLAIADLEEKESQVS